MIPHARVTSRPRWCLPTDLRHVVVVVVNRLALPAIDDDRRDASADAADDTE